MSLENPSSPQTKEERPHNRTSTSNLELPRLMTSTPMTQTEIHAKCQNRYYELEELLEYAVENGRLDPPHLAFEVKTLKKTLCYTPMENLNLEELCHTEAELEKLYSQLAQLITPVSLETLRITSEKYAVWRPWWQAWLLGSSSVGRNFFRQIFWVGMLLIFFMFFRRYLELQLQGAMLTSSNVTDLQLWHQFLIFLDPFLFGAIGAWIYLYKILNEYYIERSLHPKKLSTDWLRLFMGALSGGLIVHFLMPELAGERVLTQEALKETTTTSSHTEIFNSSFSYSVAALGLLAGYSVDFFYRALESMIRAILPKNVGDSTLATPKQQQIELLLKRLQETDNEEDKLTIRKMLEKL